MFVRIKHYSSDNWTKWEEIQFKGMIDGGSNLLNVASYFQSGGNLMEDGGLHNGHRAVHIDNLDKTSSQYTHIHWTLPLNFHNYNENLQHLQIFFIYRKSMNFYYLIIIASN